MEYHFAGSTSWAHRPQGREDKLDTQTLSSARSICDQIIRWQAASGGINVETCPYHRPPLMSRANAWNQDIPWLARTLYGFFDLTAEIRYKDAADGYAVFFIACMHPNKAAWSLGGALEPCYKLYREHNPLDDSLDLKAQAMYQWLLGYRTDNGNYFDCGYGWRDESGVRHDDQDVGYSCDLSDVGRGLVAYHQMFDSAEALEHAKGLAHYYLTEHKPGTMEGIWSSKIGTWVVGPVSGGVYENLHVPPDEAGWGWSTYYASHYLARLYDRISDEALKTKIRERCITSLRWTFDACQFEDGACGLAGRDDKWWGTTAGAILSFLRVRDAGFLSDRDAAHYRSRAEKARDWLLGQITEEAIEGGGYIRVTGRSKPEPADCVAWMLAWSLLCLPRIHEI